MKNKTPYMADFLDDLDNSKVTHVTIMKYSACGCTTSIADNVIKKLTQCGHTRSVMAFNFGIDMDNIGDDHEK